MMRKKILPGMLLVLILIQFIQPARNISGQVIQGDISEIITVPQEVKGILKRSCYDCHSNTTKYPWYANIQPFHWYLNGHIKSGKAALNFNEFGTYTQRRQGNKLRAIESSLKEGTMPLPAYVVLHRNAKLSEAQKSVLLKWVQDSKDSLDKKHPF